MQLKLRWDKQVRRVTTKQSSTVAKDDNIAVLMLLIDSQLSYAPQRK